MAELNDLLAEAVLELRRIADGIEYLPAGIAGEFEYEEPEEEEGEEVEEGEEPEEVEGEESILPPEFKQVTSKDGKIFANFGRNERSQPYDPSVVYDLVIKDLDGEAFNALGISPGYKGFVNVPLGPQTLLLTARHVFSGDFSPTVDFDIEVK